MNMLYGLLQPDEGEIFDRRRVGARSSRPQATRSQPASAWCTSTSCWSRSSRSPRTSCSAGRTASAGPAQLGRSAAQRSVPSCPSATGCDVDPDALVEEIPVGVQQRVEIIKALANDAKVLILDEPTAVLTPQEIDELMA